MIMKYECECGKTHRSKIEKLLMVDGGVYEVVNSIKKIVSAGRVSIVTSDDMRAYSGSVKKLLEDSGYTCTVAVISDDECSQARNKDEIVDLAAESELIVFIGGDYLSSFVTCERSMYITTSTSSIASISGGKSVVAVDNASMLKSPLNNIASGYGGLIVKLLCILDYRAFSTCYKNAECLDVLSKIESCILELFERRYIYYRDGDFTRDLSQCVVQVAVYESMLEDVNMLNNYKIVSSNLQKVIGKNILIGECDMLVGWYSFNVLRAVLSHGKPDLFYPADIVADAERIAALTNRNLRQVVSNIEIMKAGDINRLIYVLDEYKSDLVDYIDGIWERLIMAMKNYRRIYYDAGLEISASISLERLTEVISGSFCEQKQFSVLKLLRVNGEI